MTALPLRIWDSTQAQPPVGPPTISALFDSVKFPQLDDLKRSPATIRDFRTHLARWQRFWTERATAQVEDGVSSTWRGEPPAEVVAAAHLIEWRPWLRKAFELDNRAINKHVQSVGSIASAAMEAEKLARFPKIKPLEEVEAAELLYLDEAEVGKLYAAAGAATWPTRDLARKQLPFPAPAYWRAAFVLWWNLGFRTQELIAYEKHRKPLRWASITLDVTSPATDGRASCEFGWLRYVPWKQRRKKPAPLVLPMNEMLRAHLLSIRPLNWRAEDLIFPFPRICDRFYSTWESIVAQAGVAPKADLDGNVRGYLPCHFRKTCFTLHDLHEPGISPRISGHAPRKKGGDESAITTRHYINPEERLIRALTNFPQPQAFRAVLDRGRRVLFDKEQEGFD